MHPEVLFVRTCDDLAAKLQSHDEYDLLRAAALLRQPLADEHPLIHQANRTYRLKLEFRVGRFMDMRGFPPPTFRCIEDALDPDTAPPPTQYIVANLRRFLSHPVIITGQMEHSVADVIRLAANIRGGVHRTASPKDREAVLNHFAETLHIGGLPTGIRLIRAISRVTLKGLAPLKAKIIQQ